MPRSQPWGYWGSYSRDPPTRSGERRWETEGCIRGQVTSVGSWVASCKGLWKVVHSPWEPPEVELWSTQLSSQLVRAVPGMVTPQHPWPVPFSHWACVWPAGTPGRSCSAGITEPLAQTGMMWMRGDGGAWPAGLGDTLGGPWHPVWETTGRQEGTGEQAAHLPVGNPNPGMETVL